MWKNYLKIGIRNILKYRVFSIINVFGLATGMSICMLIILMMADQKSYDQFHEKKDLTYRILSKIAQSTTPNASSPFPLAKAIKEDYPIIEESTNLTPGVGGDATYGQQSVEMRGILQMLLSLKFSVLVWTKAIQIMHWPHLIPWSSLVKLHNYYLEMKTPLEKELRLLIGFLAGFYPALHLSHFSPIKKLYKLYSKMPGNFSIKKVLNISQFAVSLFFIITSILIYNQFRHYLEFDYGFNSANIVNIPIQGNNYQIMANELRSVPGVSRVSASEYIPATAMTNGIGARKSGSIDEFLHFEHMSIDTDFVDNLGP